MLMRLAALPVTFPLWAIRKVAEEAENEFYDQRKILAALAELSQLHEQGEIGPEEFARDKQVLVDRLREARARQAHDGGNDRGR